LLSCNDTNLDAFRRRSTFVPHIEGDDSGIAGMENLLDHKPGFQVKIHDEGSGDEKLRKADDQSNDGNGDLCFY